MRPFKKPCLVFLMVLVFCPRFSNPLRTFHQSKGVTWNAKLVAGLGSEAVHSKTCYIRRTAAVQEPTTSSVPNLGLGNSLIVRNLDANCEAEFQAAAAVRASAFMDAAIFTSAESGSTSRRKTESEKRREFEMKFQQIQRLMRERQHAGSEFIIAVLVEDISGEAPEAAADATTTHVDEAEHKGDLLGIFLQAMDRQNKALPSIEKDGLTSVQRLEALTALNSTNIEIDELSRATIQTQRVVGMVDLSRAELSLRSHSLPPDGLYVCALSVLSSYRRRGLGKALMQYAEQFARVARAKDKDGEDPDIGLKSLWLHVENKAKGTRSLYRKLGYEELSGTNKRYAQFTEALNLGPRSGAEPNCLMRKDLWGD